MKERPWSRSPSIVQSEPRSCDSLEASPPRPGRSVLELTYSPRAESIDGRRAVIGPLAVGLAVAAVGLALSGALLVD